MVVHTWDERKAVYNKDYYDGELPDHYRAWWWTADIVWEPKARILKEVFSPANTLVCGCAKGSLVKYLLDLGIDVCGFDLSEYAITTTPFPELGGRLFCHDLATASLPFTDREFDLVVAFDFFEHQDDEHMEFVCNEAARVAKKNIFIRQPFTDLSSIENLRELYSAVGGKPHQYRMAYLKGMGIGALHSDSDNTEHPNTMPREDFLQLFPDFWEIYLQPNYYDIDQVEEPVLPFFDTMVLERKT